MTWNDLSEIANTDRVRYCSQCETAVHLCESKSGMELHAERGHCVALVSNDPEGSVATMVGIPIHRKLRFPNEVD